MHTKLLKLLFCHTWAQCVHDFCDQSVNWQDLIINGADIDLVSYTHEQNSGFHVDDLIIFKIVLEYYPQIGKNLKLWNKSKFFTPNNAIPTHRIYSDILSCDATGGQDDDNVMLS